MILYLFSLFVWNTILIVERWRTSECRRNSRHLLRAWCRCHTWRSSENCWRGRQGRYRIAYRKGICLQSSCRRRKWIFECHLLKIQFMVQRVNKDKWSSAVVRVCLRFKLWANSVAGFKLQMLQCFLSQKRQTSIAWYKLCLETNQQLQSYTSQACTINIWKKPFVQIKNGLVSGKLACTQSKTEVLNKTVI